MCEGSAAVARARSLSDGMDRVYGAVVGEILPAPGDEADDFMRLQYAEQLVRELAAVVAYVADAEARSGRDRVAAHYRRLWSDAQPVIRHLRRLGTGEATLPTSVLDEVRLGVDRLSATVDSLLRRAGSS